MTPAVLLHGFLGRGADWAPVAERLAASRRVVAPDVGGWELGNGEWEGADGHAGSLEPHPVAACRDLLPADPAPHDPEPRHPGGTTSPADDDAEAFDTPTPRPGGLADAADRLASRLDAERLGTVDVAGYSMGGRLGLLFALRHPARVRRLVLVSASPGLRTPDERAARRAHDAALARDLAADFPAFLDKWTRQPLFSTFTETQRGQIVADRLAHGDPHALARTLVAMGTGAMPTLWEPLRAIRAETHAVAGALDAKFVALAHAMAGTGRVTPHVLPAAGHALLSEAPGPLADLLLDLLA